MVRNLYDVHVPSFNSKRELFVVQIKLRFSEEKAHIDTTGASTLTYVICYDSKTFFLILCVDLYALAFIKGLNQLQPGRES